MIFVGKFWSDAPADSLSGAGVGSDGLRAGDTTETAATGSPLGSSPVEMPAWGSLLMQFGLALLVVVVLILILQRVARRFGSQWKRGQNFDDIQIVAERSMGQKLSLAVVEVSDQRWLVSISPQGIQRVADIDYEAESPLEVSPAAKTLAAVGAEDLPLPGVGVGGLSPEEFNQFEQQLKTRLEVTGKKYTRLSKFEARS